MCEVCRKLVKLIFWSTNPDLYSFFKVHKKNKKIYKKKEVWSFLPVNDSP